MQGQEEKDTKKIALPRYFELNCYTDYMEITRTWFSVFKFIAVLIFGLVFSGVWIGNGFLEVLTSDRDLLLKLFALTFIILGSSLLYYSIAIYFNKTQILVSQDAIEIKHRPIPWLGNKRVEAKNIWRNE